MGNELRANTASVVSRYLSLLGERSVVMHGPDPEEEGLSGSDVDIFVRRIDLAWPLRLPPSSRLTQELRYDFGAWYWVIEGPEGFVALDTTDDPRGLGRDTVRTPEVLDRMGVDDLGAFRAAYLAIKRVRKGDVRPAEWERIGLLARADVGSFERALRVEVGETIAAMLRPWSVEGTAPPADVVRSINRARYLRRFGSVERLALAFRSASHRYAQRLLYPSGFVVALVGPDGTGKSTLADSIPVLCGTMFKRVVRVHWRPGLLPRPGAIAGKAPSDPSRPHARPPFSPIASVGLLGYYWLDFLLGDMFTLRHARIRSGLVVQERGWWDIVVDPRRYRLDVPSWLVRTLGATIREPDLTIVLEGSSEVLHARKPELEVTELDRQREAWNRVPIPARQRVTVDVDVPPERVGSEVQGSVVAAMERRATRRLAFGWARVGDRWWIPRGPRAVSRGAFSTYRPPTSGRLAVWRAARTFAGWGGLRLVPRSEAPPREVRTRLASYVPPRGSYAVARAGQQGRFVANLLDHRGVSVGFAKVATHDDDAEVLAAEAKAIGRLATRLPSPLAGPTVLAEEPGLLVLGPIDWIQEQRPWILPAEVGFALGRFSTTARHGDVAPWNLLQTSEGWALLDWESATEGDAGFDDLCHHVAVSFALLGAPDAATVVNGFRNLEGPVGRAVVAFSDGGGRDPHDAAAALGAYLRDGRVLGDRTANERRGASRLAALRVALGA